MMKQLAANSLQFQQQTVQFQQQTEASIQNLQTQIGQLATSLNQLQPQGPNTLPSQTIPNPKGNVSAISLRSGRQIQEPKLAADVTESTSRNESEKLKNDSKNKQAMKQAEKESDIPIPLPFPQRTTQSQKMAEKVQDKDILETFRKVEINISLLDESNKFPNMPSFLRSCVPIRGD